MFRPFPALAAHERARVLLIVVFAVSGVLAFSWLARIPSVRDQLGLTPADLGVILLVGSVGALATVFSSGPLMERFGSVRVFAAGSVVVAVGFTLMGVGPALGSWWVFGLGILVNGVGGSLLTVPMNVESARIERAHGRSVIPHFHAAFSAGAVGGSMLGAGASTTGVPVVVQFAVLGIAVALVRLAALGSGMVLPAAAGRVAVERPSSPASALGVWAEPRTLVIGLVAFAAALAEGAANNWLALAFVDGFGSTEASAGLALGVFIGSMAIVRIVGARAIDRIGRVATLHLSIGLALLGVAAFGLADRPAVALVGVALWGAGAALCFPIAVAAVSDEPWRAQSRVSVIAAMGSVAALTAAPMVGLVADVFGGAQHALLVVLVPLLAGLLGARWAAPSLARVADPREVLAEAPEPARAA